MNVRRLAPGLSPRTRRRGALIAALTLPLSLIAAPAIAQGPTPPATTSSKTTVGTTEATLKAAWDQAAKTGKPVEVPTHSTETMKVWANPDGKNMRAELHTRPVQLKNAASGTWEPIDTRIVTRDGKLQATRVKTPLTFGGRGAKQLVSAPGKHGEIGLGVTRGLPEPKVSGNAVTYPDAVAPGADLVVLAQADGFISQVVFRQRPTAPVTVRLPLTLPEGTTFGKTSQGLPQLKDTKGKAKAAPIVLTATDAKVEAAPDQGRTHPVKAQVESTGKTSELVFTPDEKFLADPAVTYPVTVAASSTWFGGGAPDDAWISKNDPYNNNSAAGYLRAGTTSTSADIARVYLKFNTSDPVLQGATVNDADLRIWNYKSGGPNGQLCGETMGAGIRAARVTGEWTLDGTIDSLDWYNQPPSTAPEEVNRAGYNYDADPASWCAKDEELFYEVTAMTRAWIQQGQANHGIVLKAASETAAINWRQYYSSQFGGGSPYPGYRHPPALIITYTPAPTHPEGHTLLSDSPIDMDTLTDAEANAMVTQVSTAAPDVPATTTEESSAVRSEAEDPFNVVPEGSLPLDEETWEDMDPTPGQPPTVTQQIPGKDATEVNPGTLIAVQFDEPVTDTQISVKDSSGTAVAGTMSADPQATLATFTPAQRLAENTAYTVEVTGAADVAGSTMAPYSWTFTTGGADTTAPSVAGTEPADQAANVPLDTEIKVTFSEAVSEVQITVKDASDTSVQGTVAGGPSRWTFKPAAPLAASKAHRVDVSGAKDASGNVMAPYTWSFTTGADTPPPVPGLVAAYGINEGSGTSVADSSGQNNPGTGSGTAWANGKYGKALSFNGSSSMVTVAHAASLRLTTGMTLSAWVNPTTVTGTPWRSVATKELSADGASYAIYAANGGGVPSGWVQTDPDTPATADGLSPLPVNSWSHLALTYDGAALRLFVNGQQIDQTPLSGSLHDDGSPLRIGGNTVWSEYFSGLIDEVRVYNRAQTAAEIQTDMNTPIGAAATSTATQRQRLDAAADPAPGIDKLTVDGSRTTDAAAVASTLTPRLTAWLSAGRDGEAKVEVEIARKPTKPAKSVKEGKEGKVSTDRRLIWSGEVTAKPGETRVSLQIPEGKLRDGEKARWRARIVTDQQTEAGGWTAWSQLAVTTAPPPEPAKTSAPTASESAQAMLAPSDFPYDPITFAQCWQNMNRATRAGGYTKNSFNWCGSWYLHQMRERESKLARIVEVEQNTGVVGYRFSYAIRTAVGNKVADKKGDSDAVKAQKRANAEVGARNIEVWVIIDQVKPFDNLPDSATMAANGKLTVDFEIKGDPGGSCKPLAGHDNSPVTRTLQNWNNYSHHFRFTSDKLASTGANRVST